MGDMTDAELAARRKLMELEYKRREQGNQWLTAVILLAVAAIIGPVMAWSITDASARTEAVMAGVARWVPNADGSTRFEWIRKGGK